MSSIIKGLTKETNVSRVTPVRPVVRSKHVQTEPKQNVYEPSAEKQEEPVKDKKPVDDSSIHLIAEKKKKPKPTSPEKWSRAKAKARSKFDVYPSAYANAYASKEYKKMGGGWRMGESYETEALDYLKEKRSDILSKFNLNQILTAINENITENKINLRRAIAGLEMGHYDHLNEISDFKKQELAWELRNEPKNNYAVNINGKQWKVFASKEQAEKAAKTIERKYNKKATVHLTGAAPTNEAAVPTNNITLGKPTKAEIDDPKDIVFEYPIYNNGKLIGQFTFSKFFGEFYGSMGGKILPDLPTKLNGGDPMVANKIFNDYIMSPSGQRIVNTMKSATLKPQGQRYNVAEGAPELLKQEMPLVRHIEKELEQYGYMKGTAEYDEKFKHAIAFYRKFGNIDAIKQGVAEANPVNVWARRSGGIGSVSPVAPDLRASELPIDIIGEPDRYLAQKLYYDISRGRAARDLFYNTQIDKENLGKELEQIALKSKLKKDPSGLYVYDVYSPVGQGVKNHITYLEYQFGKPMKKERFAKKPKTPDITSEEQAPMFTPEDEQLDELKCWPGYTRVRGVPAGAPGSCKKKTKESSIMKGLKR